MITVYSTVQRLYTGSKQFCITKNDKVCRWSSQQEYEIWYVLFATIVTIYLYYQQFILWVLHAYIMPIKYLEYESFH